MFWGVGSGFPVYKAVELRLAQSAGIHTVEGAESTVGAAGSTGRGVSGGRSLSLCRNRKEAPEEVSL